MANIICMKWGTKYGPEYVNRLASMVRRNITIPYRFVCMTDDATGLDAGIDARPLPDFDDPGGPERGWRKISTFRRPLFDLEGPTLFLDIDIVIVGNIDCLFSHPGETPVTTGASLFPLRELERSGCEQFFCPRPVNGI